MEKWKNRSTHRFLPPNRLLDTAMEAGTVDPQLPGIKAQAVSLLSANYVNKEEAIQKVRRSLSDYYKREFGDGYGPNRQRVEQAIEGIADIYDRNFFPEMHARWDNYPDNIGHMTSPGCFRCHGGELTSADGRTITRDCTACHTIIEQGPPGNLVKSTDGLPFQHPVDIEEAWTAMNCYECHTGGVQ